nr:RecName: Full=NADPH oxidoreductase; AltName: Full=BmNOX [Bombyx mori]
SMIGGVMSKG